MIPDTFVGIILLQTQKDPFPMYMAMRPPWVPPALRDLDIGGSLMWSVGDGLMMLLCVGIVISLISGRTSDRILGPWLESVRTNTLDEHIERTGGGRIDGDARCDDRRRRQPWLPTTTCCNGSVGHTPINDPRARGLRSPQARGAHGPPVIELPT